MDQLRVVIAGGGIGGLAAAIALHRDGHRVTVVDPCAAPEGAGSGIVLYPNGMRALSLLTPALAAAVRAAGHEAVPGESRPVLTQSGTLLATDPVGALTARYGAPHVSLLRSALLSCLRTSSSGVDFVRGSVVDHSGASVRLASGAELAGDLLVAADGIRSGVRSRLLDDGPAPYSGFTTLRACCPAPAAFPHGFVVKGAGLDLFAAPVGGGRIYWTAKIIAPAGVWPFLDPAEAYAKVCALVSDWHPPVRDVIHTTGPDSGIVLTDVRDRDPLPTWAYGRVALLGDAAHPMTPALGQGAGMSFEDAVVLASSLRASGDVPAALAAYSQARAGRVAEVIRLSRWKGPAGDPQGFATDDPRLAHLFAWQPPRERFAA